MVSLLYELKFLIIRVILLKFSLWWKLDVVSRGITILYHFGLGYRILLCKRFIKYESWNLISKNMFLFFANP